jgi:hypothetical protein
MTLSIDQAVCNSFKSQLLGGAHDFDSGSGQVFKLALYQSNAVLNATTTVFTSTNEVGSILELTVSGGGVLARTNSFIRWFSRNSRFRRFIFYRSYTKCIGCSNL